MRVLELEAAEYERITALKTPSRTVQNRVLLLHVCPSPPLASASRSPPIRGVPDT
jgi:hypothetical protein